MGTPIIVAKKTSDTTQDVVLHSQFANRHGLIAGATGTGKTVTLKVLAESFSRLGVPVFFLFCALKIFKFGFDLNASDFFILFL